MGVKGGQPEVLEREAEEVRGGARKRPAEIHVRGSGRGGYQGPGPEFPVRLKCGNHSHRLLLPERVDVRGWPG